MKITLCIDKQSRDNPSSELKQYLIDIGCPLRSYEGVFDELKISTDDTNNLIGAIIRRCYVDKYGVLKKLEVEETQELEIPEITLFEGTNYVYIQEFTNLNMKIEYLTNAEMNKYFATKAEMNSTIKQTYDSIMLAVSEKAGIKEVSAMIKLLSDEIALKVAKEDVVNELNISDELISIIGNRLKIDTDNFKLTEIGEIAAVAGNVGGYTLSDNNLSALITTEIEYTENDLQTIQDYYLDRIELSDEEFERLDFNKDGVINLFDAVLIQNIVNSNITPSKPGKFEINANDPNYNLVIYDGNGNKRTAIGLDGVKTTKVSAAEIEQTSLESKKKNFELFNRGLELITSSDFYLYNLKTEKDNDKKHIGLIIGDEYKTSTEFISNSGSAIDLYSLISACGDAIKTLNNRVIELKNKIKELEGDK